MGEPRDPIDAESTDAEPTDVTDVADVDPIDADPTETAGHEADADGHGNERPSGFVPEADPAARGGLYALLARAFDSPDDALYEAFAEGTFATELATLCERTELDLALGPDGDVDPAGLVTDDDRSTLDARYNDLFVIGYAEYVDRTDGTLDANEPAVPLYESAYREDVSWTDVNLDLARAYNYFGLGIDQDEREHHDFLRLELEFAGYLARRAATVDADAGRARLDFLDRHLRVLAAGVAERIGNEPGTGVYGALAELLEALVAADRADLAARFDDRSGGGTDGRDGRRAGNRRDDRSTSRDDQNGERAP